MSSNRRFDHALKRKQSPYGMKAVDEIYKYTLQNAYKRLDESNISQHDREINLDRIG